MSAFCCPRRRARRLPPSEQIGDEHGKPRRIGCDAADLVDAVHHGFRLDEALAQVRGRADDVPLQPPQELAELEVRRPALAAEGTRDGRVDVDHVEQRSEEE